MARVAAARRTALQHGLWEEAEAADVASGGTLRIERLILHELDTAGEAPRLMEARSVLEQRDHEYFHGQLEEAARRADWDARFRQAEGEVLALCHHVLGSEDEFVRASRDLAQRLWEQMRRRERISPGDLVVLIFAQGDQPERHIALLKLDREKRLRRRFDRAGGALRTVFSEAEDLLPEAKHLQKCAILRQVGGEQGFVVRLLDNQAGPTSEGVAAFFFRGFLDLELEPSARRRTRLFLMESDRWLDAHRQVLAPMQVLQFYRTRRAVLSSRRVVLADFAAQALGEHASLRDSLVRALEERLFAGHVPAPDGFDVDAQAAERALRYLTLELDGGLRLRVDDEHFDDLVDVVETPSGDALRLTITSHTLREVSG